MDAKSLPGLPLAEWQDTKTTLHLFIQIVGKIRMALHPKLNHWWHVPLYVSPRGLTTGPIPVGDRSFDMEFNFLLHQLVFQTSDGKHAEIGLPGQSPSSFFKEVFDALAKSGIEARILAKPFDPSRVKSEIPFAKDTEHTSYDSDSVTDFSGNQAPSTSSGTPSISR
jgi:hypothetical protein